MKRKGNTIKERFIRSCLKGKLAVFMLIMIYLVESVPVEDVYASQDKGTRLKYEDKSEYEKEEKEQQDKYEEESITDTEQTDSDCESNQKDKNGYMPMDSFQFVEESKGNGKITVKMGTSDINRLIPDDNDSQSVDAKVTQEETNTISDDTQTENVTQLNGKEYGELDLYSGWLEVEKAHEGLVYLEGQYVYEVAFNVCIDVEEDSWNSDSEIKYIIYDTDLSDADIKSEGKSLASQLSKTILKEELLKGKTDGSVNKQIKYQFTKPGDYAIYIQCDGEVAKSLNYSIQKEDNFLLFHNKSTSMDLTCKYGDEIYLDELLYNPENEKDINRYEIIVKNEDDEKLVEVSDGERQSFTIKGLKENAEEKISIGISCPENNFQSRSNVLVLNILTEKLEPQFSVSANENMRAYENLLVTIDIEGDDKEIVEKLINEEKAYFVFDVSCSSTTPEYSLLASAYIEDKRLELTSDKKYVLPITSEYFNNMSSLSEYVITITLKYDMQEGECALFDEVSEEVHISVEGDSININTSLDKENIDYRSEYNKTVNMTVEIDGADALGNDKVIKYKTSAIRSNIVELDDAFTEYTGNVIPLKIIGVGTETVIVSAVVEGDESFKFKPARQPVTVSDSEFCDKDITVTHELNTGESVVFETTETETAIEQWKSYLNKNNGWINGKVHIALSDTGKNYYNKIGSNVSAEAQVLTLSESTEKTEHEIWTLNTDNNANTKNAKNGTRKFVLGIDNQKPVSDSFSYSQNYFEPTKTDNEQYYATDFEIMGSFTDAESGVSKIEYTTDYNVESDALKWITIATADSESTSKLDYKITLGNGNYNAIAVRAYDNAGNISEITGIKNSKNEFVNIIVDDLEPHISVEAFVDGALYNLENENWTNKAVTYKVNSVEHSTIAGIYQCEYAFESILESKMKKENHEWNTLNKTDTLQSDVLIMEIGKEEPENKNGYYLFRAVSKSGVKTTIPVKKRILLQQTMPEKKDIVATGVSDNYKGEWYNKKSGVPILHFEFPDYDDGNTSGEYEAPVTIHYNLWVENEAGEKTQLVNNKNATIGVGSSDNFENGRFIVSKDNLEDYKVDFGYNVETGYAVDGIYTLEYWISDMAANISKKRTISYKIDCHEPTQLMVKVADMDMPVDSENDIVYQSFYNSSVSASASAQYGISGKGSIKILKAKKIGEWSLTEATQSGESFEIAPCNRCFLYVVARDKAGNETEGWTRGIVVDNAAPVGNGSPELIVEPEGANEHGFYNKDIEVNIKVSDAPDGDNCAAIMCVSESVGADGIDTISDKNLFSFTKELPTNEELTNAENFNTVQIIDAKANESNNAYIEVIATDRSNNEKVSAQILKIDVTKPEIDITFDNNEAINNTYFNKNRTATIHIKELNFNQSYVNIEITKDKKSYSIPISEWTHNENDHYATVLFSEDGDYAMTVKCKDLADNESESVSVDTFTIDKTLPKVELKLLGDNQNEFYYKAGVTAEIQVTEHNFDINNFNFIVSGKSHNKEVFKWTHENDIYKTQITFTEDSDYTIEYECVDKAGNSSKSLSAERFVVDTQAPEILISGVEDGSANSGEVVPVITITDKHFSQNGGKIVVKTGSGESVNIKNTVKSIITPHDMDVSYASAANKYVYTLNDMNTKSDNIYYLEVNAIDLAGNEQILKYKFSLNRNGSVYDIKEIKSLTDKYYNSYNAISDVKIYEMNVDKVESFDLYISRNGTMLTGEQVKSKPTANDFKDNKKVLYSVDMSGNDNIGYTYKYTIYRENFATEGTYRMSFYSKDRAGNEVNNTLKVNGEDISFVVDDTEPRVIIEGIESGKIYDTSAHTVNVMVTDNFKLNEAKFVLVNTDGQELEAWDYNELVQTQGEMATITIPTYDEEVSLIFSAKDAAGNEIVTLPDSKVAVSDFLVTTDKWIQMINKPTKSPVGIVSIFVLAGLFMAVSVVSILIIKKR